jgi:hypothetical protein
MPHDKGLWVASVVGPRCDPAFDVKHAEWLTLAQKYARTRAPSDLEKLPVREGRRPRLYEIGLLTPRQFSRIDAMPDPMDRDLSAVCVAALRVKHPDGHLEEAPIAAKGDQGSAADVEKWPARLQELGGMNLIRELASVIQQRAEAGDVDEAEGGADPLERFALPRGLLLGR